MLLTHTISKQFRRGDNTIHRVIYFNGNAGKERDVYIYIRDKIKKFNIIS